MERGGVHAAAVEVIGVFSGFVVDSEAGAVAEEVFGAYLLTGDDGLVFEGDFATVEGG